MIKVFNVISDTNIGGAGKCVLTFLKYYNKSEFDVTVVLPKGSLLIPMIEQLNGKYIEIDGIADKSLDISAISKLNKLFKCEKPDIIHCHASMSARISARLYKLGKKAKIVYTRHSVFEPSKIISKGIGKIINGFVNNITADRIIAVADAAKDNIVKTGVNPNKIIVIQNGVEPLKYLDEQELLKLKSKYNVEDECLLGIVARLNEVKGHTYILEAVKMLKDDGIKVKLLIAGTGESEQAIRDKAAELDIVHEVIMAGFVSDVTGIMNLIDVNMNASFGTEATSLSLLEGMSVGTPCIVSDFGGNPGVVTHGYNGLMFKTKDSRDMYEKIRYFITEPGVKQQLSENSVKLFNEKFKAEIMTRNIETVYKSMTEEK